MKFAVENFKIFKERQEFDIRPITILVGPNGSGKSSVIEAMQLFAGFNDGNSNNQLAKLTRLNFSHLAQYGTLKNFLQNKELKNNFLTIDFTRQISFRNQFLETGVGSKLRTSLVKIYDNEDLINLSLKYCSKGILQQLRMVSDDNLNIFELNKGNNGAIKVAGSYEVTLNFDFFYTQYLSIMKSEEFVDYVPFDKSKNFLKLEPNLSGNFEKFPLLGGIELQKYAERFSGQIGNSTYVTGNQYSLQNFDVFPGSFLNTTNEDKHNLMNFMFKYDDSANGYAAKDFFELFIKNCVNKIIEGAIAPYSGLNIITTNRQHKPTSVSYNEKENELQRQIHKFSKLDDNSKRTCLGYLNKIMKIQFAEKFDSVDVIENIDKLGCSVMLKKNGIEYNLFEQGYGFVNSFPILIALALAQLGNKIRNGHYEDVTSAEIFSRVIAIMEPEMNLHPNAQSKLADILSSFESIQNYFLIETHSEYLVRRLQYLVAKGEINKGLIQIYYFHSENEAPEGEKQVYPINIEEDGSLTKNFGKGFYDEAGNLDLLLYQMDRTRKN